MALLEENRAMERGSAKMAEALAQAPDAGFAAGGVRSAGARPAGARRTTAHQDWGTGSPAASERIKQSRRSLANHHQHLQIRAGGFTVQVWERSAGDRP